MSRAPTWTDDEMDIIRRPISNEQAVQHLTRAGYTRRTTRAVNAQRSRIEDHNDVNERRLAQHVMHIALFTLEGGRYKIAHPPAILRQAVERKYVRAVTASQYRVTLLGIAWLERTYGSQWREWAAERAFESA